MEVLELAAGAGLAVLIRMLLKQFSVEGRQILGPETLKDIPADVLSLQKGTGAQALLAHQDELVEGTLLHKGNLGTLGAVLGDALDISLPLRLIGGVAFQGQQRRKIEPIFAGLRSVEPVRQRSMAEQVGDGGPGGLALHGVDITQDFVIDVPLLAGRLIGQDVQELVLVVAKGEFLPDDRLEGLHHAVQLALQPGVVETCREGTDVVRHPRHPLQKIAEVAVGDGVDNAGGREDTQHVSRLIQGSLLQQAVGHGKGFALHAQFPLKVDWDQFHEPPAPLGVDVGHLRLLRMHVGVTGRLLGGVGHAHAVEDHRHHLGADDLKGDHAVLKHRVVSPLGGAHGPLQRLLLRLMLDGLVARLGVAGAAILPGQNIQFLQADLVRLVGNRHDINLICHFYLSFL